MKKSIAILLGLTALLSCSVDPPVRVNIAHLLHLCETVGIDGEAVTLVRIYSDAPDYDWVEAPGEGIACVDDVARAAVVLMRAAETGTANVEDVLLRQLLRFVVRMQTEDGEFYNFIFADQRINRDGKTSVKSFSFWAARGYWALGHGYRYYLERDSDFAAELRRAFDRCLIPLAQLDERFGQMETIDGRLYPRWLIHGSAADATSEFLLGLAQVLAVDPDSHLLHHARRLAHGLVAMQVQEPQRLQGAFLSWPGIWHAWGNAQIQALAALHPILQDSLVLEAARAGADFRARLMISGPLSHIPLDGSKAQTYPMIAYDIRTAALGFLQLYRAVGDEKYAVLAGLAASALTGANPAKEPLYQPESGRIYDGIDAGGINRNSGAESTIEGLYTLVEIAPIPQALAWLGADAEPPDENGSDRLFRRKGRTAQLSADPTTRVVTVTCSVEGEAR
ncbi:hypothetical protein JW992_09870 [candidate division KSB1 bacterium]|nr:hypothetical protein [candidate division KSB1 bacterium]